MVCCVIFSTRIPGVAASCLPEAVDRSAGTAEFCVSGCHAVSLLACRMRTTLVPFAFCFFILFRPLGGRLLRRGALALYIDMADTSPLPHTRATHGTCEQGRRRAALSRSRPPVGWLDAGGAAAAGLWGTVGVEGVRGEDRRGDRPSGGRAVVAGG